MPPQRILLRPPHLHLQPFSLSRLYHVPTAAPAPFCRPRNAPPTLTARSIVLRPLSLLPRHAAFFHSTPTLPRDHHFDTLKFVQRLEAEGFSRDQSEALLRVLSDVVEESIQNLTRTMVPREDQEKINYAQKVDFAKLRSELTALHGSELNPIKNDQERLNSEISRLSARLREEVQRAQSSVKLDLNLEKGRIREESSVHELKIKETDTRIEKEVGDLRGMLESVKFSTLQWLIGVCTGTAALLLGVWRLLM
ncbi:hypothetical protein BZA05DRAFT_400928 [Tricharina praecox]|uniref:uncharacterized protein n=1 Tax=Tricharina praecox TaxID=43433 RepID=UPI0022201D2E|nr:uncharacterized protein BZA05DRAFT_400928 [Tricharina praecox]KAI5850090.1 hypothetical protein BZA05DRAFT_400928 [Tricharina praecox]